MIVMATITMTTNATAIIISTRSRGIFNIPGRSMVATVLPAAMIRTAIVLYL